MAGHEHGIGHSEADLGFSQCSPSGGGPEVYQKELPMEVYPEFTQPIKHRAYAPHLPQR